MTKQDFIDLLIINDAADDITDSVSTVFSEIGEEGVRGKVNLPPHGREFFHFT